MDVVILVHFHLKHIINLNHNLTLEQECPQKAQDLLQLVFHNIESSPVAVQLHLHCAGIPAIVIYYRQLSADNKIYLPPFDPVYPILFPSIG